jgi:hypothetical protein
MKEDTDIQSRRERYAGYVEGRLSEGEMAAFDRDLRQDESLRREFADWLNVEGSLRAEAETLFAEEADAPSRIIAFPPVLRWAAAAALLVGGLGLGWWIRPVPEAPVTAAAVVEIPAVATLADTRAAKWGAGSLPTEEGSRLQPGRLELLEGLATLRFDSGVTVTLEAPVTLEVESGTRCRLVSGAAVAWVPDGAEGFQIQTADALLTDYGTRFGVTADEGGKSQVLVLEGEVGVAHRLGDGEKRLKTGEMVRYDAERLLESVGGDGETLRGGAREQQLAPGWVALTTADGRGQDTCVRQGDAGGPYGHSPLLMVKNSAAFPGNRRKAWLSFDLASLGGKGVAEAELVLSIEPSGLGYASVVPDATFRVYGLKDESLDAAWDAASLLWSEAPANGLDDGFSLDPAKVVPLGEFVVEQGVSSGQRRVSGEALADFLNADTNGVATLIVVRLTDETDRHGLVHAFASREHPVAMPPTLRVRKGL